MDAFTAALTLLSRRELSARQLRDRLTRRGFTPDEVEDTIRRLIADHTLDDRRLAMTVARSDAVVRRRGRRRVRQHLQHLGVASDVSDQAIEDVFGEIDEGALLDQALARGLRGGSADDLDTRGLARLVRRLIGQGFEAGEIYARLRRKRAEGDE